LRHSFSACRLTSAKEFRTKQEGCDLVSLFSLLRTRLCKHSPRTCIGLQCIGNSFYHPPSVQENCSHVIHVLNLCISGQVQSSCKIWTYNVDIHCLSSNWVLTELSNADPSAWGSNGASLRSLPFPQPLILSLLLLLLLLSPSSACPYSFLLLIFFFFMPPPFL